MNQDRDALGSGFSLNQLLAGAGLPPLDKAIGAKFDQYLALILHWNSRMNLTAIRNPEEIQSRHFIESIASARLLPESIGSLLDFGSGAGFPGIPIALCRPEIAVTLAESQSKKAAFLHEAVRVLGIDASVFSKRAEQLDQQFDCVTLRAVDRMEDAVAAALRLVRSGGWLAVLTTQGQLSFVQESAGSAFRWLEPLPLPRSEQRLLALGSKEA